MDESHKAHPHYPAAMAAVGRLKAAGWTGSLGWRSGGWSGGWRGAGWFCTVFTDLPAPRDSGNASGDDPYRTLRAAVWAALCPVGFYRNVVDPLAFEAVDLMRKLGLEPETPA